jgi:hypothetical protein
MSTICIACPQCGGGDVHTRIVSLILARCVCRSCRHAWVVPVEPAKD